MATDPTDGAGAPTGTFAGLSRADQIALLASQLRECIPHDHAAAMVKKAAAVIAQVVPADRFERPRDAVFALLLDALCQYGLGMDVPPLANQVLVGADDAGVDRGDIVKAMAHGGMKLRGENAKKNLRTRLQDTRAKTREAMAARDAAAPTVDPALMEVAMFLRTYAATVAGPRARQT